jgi:8-oxo-dGTP pyrophosphatase MutT (NUDIX family)
MARVAATLLLGANGASRAEMELLMIFRSPASRFMPRALVFPGGVLDKSDIEWSEAAVGRFGLSSAHAHALALRRCVLRELFEETGVILPRMRGSARGSRQEVCDHPERFEELLGDVWGSYRDGHALFDDVPVWGRYQTPRFEPTQFDAWFLAASMGALPRGAVDAEGVRMTTVREIEAVRDVHDWNKDGSAEASAAVWISPREALRLNEEGRVLLPPPQWITMHELSGDAHGSLPLSRAAKAVVDPADLVEWARDRQSQCDSVGGTVGGLGTPKNRVELRAMDGAELLSDRRSLERVEDARFAILFPADSDHPEAASAPWAGWNTRFHRRRMIISPRSRVSDSGVARIRSLYEEASAGAAALEEAAREKRVGTLPFDSIRFTLEEEERRA